MKPPRLGELLIEAGLLTQRTLDEVLRKQETDRRRLGELLVEADAVSEGQVAQILSQQLSVPWISLGHIVFSQKILSLISPELAYRYRAVPVYLKTVGKLGNVLYLAMDDPTCQPALEAISKFSGLPTRPMIASPTELTQAIEQLYEAA